jgi:hypothetical protein
VCVVELPAIKTGNKNDIRVGALIQHGGGHAREIASRVKAALTL